MSCPQNVLIVGSSGTGKSTFVERLLTTPDAWETPIDNFMYCYGIYSETVKKIAHDLPHITLVEGLPRNLASPFEIFSPRKCNVLVCDDLSTESQASKEFTNFMMRGSHHCNCCLISIEHFLFSQAKERRLQSPHWHQCVLFKNQRSMHQITTLARQASIADLKTVQYAYNDAISKPFGYLILDFRNETPTQFRLITNVFHENQEPCYIYL